MKNVLCNLLWGILLRLENKYTQLMNELWIDKYFVYIIQNLGTKMFLFPINLIISEIFWHIKIPDSISTNVLMFQNKYESIILVWIEKIYIFEK